MSSTTTNNEQPTSNGAEKSSVVVPVPETKDADEALALRILRIIETYGVNYERSDESWEGLKGFLELVTKNVKNKEPVLMLLPGFPFKAPNAVDKVLGVLPDLGEELALSHLNSICDNIEAIYEHGAEIHICSDGLVYNDLLGVSDEDVWNYGEGVRQIAKERGLRHLKFIRLWDLLEHPGPWTPEFYKTHASCIRREMVVRYRDLEFEADMAKKSNEDVRMTHAGYLKAVSKDLQYSPVLADLDPEARELKVQSIAKSMMGRWKAYAAALEANRTEYVRLSIHDSKGGSKLSMALLPQARGAIGFTPWHSTVVVELDGTYRTAHVSEVRDTYDLVCVNGRPSHYCAKTDMFDWKAEGLDVDFKFLYPTGLRITSKNGASFGDIPAQKARKLANSFSPVILRGFSGVQDRSLFEAKGKEFGTTLPKQEGDAVSPYSLVRTPAAVATSAETTRFVNSRLFLRYLPAPWTPEKVHELVEPHKETGVPCVKRNRSHAEQPLQDLAQAQENDYRVALRGGLEEGDVLVIDNGSVIARFSGGEPWQLAFE